MEKKVMSKEYLLENRDEILKQYNSTDRKFQKKAYLTKKERKAVRDILFQQAQREGILRGTLMRSQEKIHESGI